MIAKEVNSEQQPGQHSKSFFARLGNILSVIEDMSAVLILLFIVFLICLSIFMRITFSYESSAWEELSRFLSLWMYLIGVAIASKENSHLRMGFLDSKITSVKVKQGMEVVFNLVASGCLFIFAKWSLEYVQWSMMAEQQSLVMMISMWTVHLSFFVGSALATLHMLYHLVKSILIFIGRKETRQ